MTDKYILVDGEPRPASLMEWAEWFESSDRQIENVFIGDARVSTVFLGIDLAFEGGAPLLFETMIFGGPHDGDQWRYSTLDEAHAGHAHAVSIAKQTVT